MLGTILSIENFTNPLRNIWRSKSDLRGVNLKLEKEHLLLSVSQAQEKVYLPKVS